MTTLDSTKASLNDLLREIRESKVQLPDFHRGWVWDDDHIRDLLVSIARSFCRHLHKHLPRNLKGLLIIKGLKIPLRLKQALGSIWIPVSCSADAHPGRSAANPHLRPLLCALI
ncbi:hypothetical protein CKO08_06515 [Halorhodospira halochloris]|nr:hypothetical protein [Halorhodospira halochloris]